MDGYFLGWQRSEYCTNAYVNVCIQWHAIAMQGSIDACFYGYNINFTCKECTFQCNSYHYFFQDDLASILVYM